MRRWAVEGHQRFRFWNQGFLNAQVTVDSWTLELRVCPGLYLAGEGLDVDGPCGGYNLQWAWASGAVAGNNAAMD